MIELRWVVDERTSKRDLQYRFRQEELGLDKWSDWLDVPEITRARLREEEMSITRQQ